MPLQPFARFSPLPIIVLAGFCLLLMVVPAAAQDEQPAPQFLYRDKNHLVLLDGYTGEATQLPFEIASQDRFEWSPDGHYVLARLYDSRTYKYCLNLYDIDAQTWLYQNPISCTVGEAIFSEDGQHIIYASSDEINATLWQYSLADKRSQKLYQTTEGDKTIPEYIADLQWSPTKTYLTFVDYLQIAGGTINRFGVMNVKSHENFILKRGGGYYASYNPIWSKDDSWFAIDLKEEYVTTSSVPITNHEGDVYLVNSETGDAYRMTYTPADYEGNIHWTDDGKIAFDISTVHVEEFSYTPEQAAHIAVVPDNEIVTPEPVNPEEYAPNPLSNLIMSPDPNIAAWVSSKHSQKENEKDIWQLNIGDNTYSNTYPTAQFFVPIPEPQRYNNVLIGWRPSDYGYQPG